MVNRKYQQLLTHGTLNSQFYDFAELMANSSFNLQVI